MKDDKPSPPISAGINALKGSHLEPLVEQYAGKAGVSSSLVKAVIRAESGGNPHAVSSAGAKGLMQLMPATAKGLGVNNPLNPAENIEGGSKYLGQLMKKYRGNKELALAAYNAGSGAVAKYGGIPPYKETQNYVKKVLKYEEQLK
jgi:soluble lytic murein transglycosylase-like protein